MSTMSELHAKVDAFGAKLSGVADHLVTEFHDLVDELLGQGKKDGEQLATDAEAAVKPVIAEAEHDAAALGESAVQETEQATQTAAADLSTQSASAAAPATETKPQA